jgi:carbamoyltransferase
VSRSVDPLFWDLIEAFRSETGVPILLNTSFNSDAEPIADSVDDAVACFLTTGLQRLIVGGFVVTKSAAPQQALLELSARLPAHMLLVEESSPGAGQLMSGHAIVSTPERRRHELAAATYRVLKRASPHRSVLEGLQVDGDVGTAEAVATELGALWADRAVVMRPVERET